MEARAMSSPLEPIFGRAQAPAAFKAQFLHSVDDPSRIVLEGTLHHVWHRPRWLRPLFQVLGRLHILVPDTGTEIPTTLEVVAKRLPDGRAIAGCWRKMHLPQRRQFPTRSGHDARRGRLRD